MLSRKTSNRKRSRNYKKTKKRNNIKSKIKKYKINKYLTGGAEPLKYNHIHTIENGSSDIDGTTEFQLPCSVAVSEGLIYVVDTRKNSVDIFDENTREYIRKLGTEVNNEGETKEKFNHPSSIAVSILDNSIYISNFDNNSIEVYDKEYKYKNTINYYDPNNKNIKVEIKPMGLAISSFDNIKKIYVASYYNKCIYVFDNEYKYLQTINIIKDEKDKKNKFIDFNRPMGIAISDTDKQIYVSDIGNHCIYIIDGLTLKCIKTFGTFGKKENQFSHPYGIAISNVDNLIYVADASNHRIQIFDKTTLKYKGTLNNGNKNIHFLFPTSVAVSASGKDIYVVDREDKCVHIFNKI